jgi:hypothetical protein
MGGSSQTPCALHAGLARVTDCLLPSPVFGSASSIAGRVTMEAVLAAVAGGLLAIAGGVVGTLAGDRRERERWQRDTQLQAASHLVASLQVLIRRMIDYAYLTDKSDEGNRTTVVAYHEAATSWNNAIYAALLVVPVEAAEKIPRLDREVDRLLDLAASRPWTRAEFRHERRELGRLAADYLRTSRRVAGFPDVRLRSLWSWDADLDGQAD